MLGLRGCLGLSKYDMLWVLRLLRTLSLCGLDVFGVFWVSCVLDVVVWVFGVGIPWGAWVWVVWSIGMM